jgi:predicted nucleotidyltransferase
MIGNRDISRIKKRLVARFKPRLIILFGSQARHTADARSDVDLLVVLPVRRKRRTLVSAMYDALADLRIAMDLVVLTPKEYEIDKLIPGTIARPAWLEGKIIYECR